MSSDLFVELYAAMNQQILDGPEHFGTTDPWVYHASPRTIPLQRFARGLLPSRKGISGPGVYMANHPDKTHDHTSPEEARYFRVPKAALVAQFGRYPENPEGLEFDPGTGEVLLAGKRTIPSDILEVHHEGQWHKLHDLLGREPTAETPEHYALTPQEFDRDPWSGKPHHPVRTAELQIPDKHGAPRTIAAVLQHCDEEATVDPTLRHLGGARSIDFEDASLPPGQDPFGYTGRGNAIPVMNHVAGLAHAALQGEKPRALYGSAGDASRRRLYGRAFRLLESRNPDYRAYEFDGMPGELAMIHRDYLPHMQQQGARLIPLNNQQLARYTAAAQQPTTPPQHIDWNRVKQLGTTDDYAEAGFLSPDGSMVDLSGKREGRPAGQRHYPHMEVAGLKVPGGSLNEAMMKKGYNAIVEMQHAGHIRHWRGQCVDMRRPPTEPQEQHIRNLIERNGGALSLEMADGEAPWDPEDQQYQIPEQNHYMKYGRGTHPDRIIADIRRFYSGQQPLVPPPARYAADQQLPDTMPDQPAASTPKVGTKYRERTPTAMPGLEVKAPDPTRGWKLAEGHTTDPEVVERMRQRVAQKAHLGYQLEVRQVQDGPKAPLRHHMTVYMRKGQKMANPHEFYEADQGAAAAEPEQYAAKQPRVPRPAMWASPTKEQLDRAQRIFSAFNEGTELAEAADRQMRGGVLRNGKFKEFDSATKQRNLNKIVKHIAALQAQDPEAFEAARQWALADQLGHGTYDKIPEQIEVHRGHDENESLGRSVNVTTDPEIAKRFGAQGAVSSYHVHKDDVTFPLSNSVFAEGELVIGNTKHLRHLGTQLSPAAQRHKDLVAKADALVGRQVRHQDGRTGTVTRGFGHSLIFNYGDGTDYAAHPDQLTRVEQPTADTTPATQPKPEQYAAGMGKPATPETEDVALRHFGTWGASTSSDHLYGYRGGNQDGPNIGHMAGTEGAGHYIAKEHSLASQFGPTRMVKFPTPRNPMVVDEHEPLPILHESPEIMHPPSSHDSPWMSANKEAVRRAGVTDENWGEKLESGHLSNALTAVLRERGHDAVLVKQGDDNEWVVLLHDPKATARRYAAQLHDALTCDRYARQPASSPGQQGLFDAPEAAPAPAPSVDAPPVAPQAPGPAPGEKRIADQFSDLDQLIQDRPDEPDYEPLMHFYDAAERGQNPSPNVARAAAQVLHGYYKDYMRWYRDVWDKQRHDQKTVEENQKVRAAYGQRLGELELALKANSHPHLISAVDNGINQWHLDYPVIAHLGMQAESGENEIAIERVARVLQKLGRLPPRSPYRDEPPPRAPAKRATSVTAQFHQEDYAAEGQAPATPLTSNTAEPKTLESLREVLGPPTIPDRIYPEIKRHGVKPLGPVTVHAYRVGPTEDPHGRGVFYGGDPESIRPYESLHPGHTTQRHVVSLQNALLTGHQNDVSMEFFGKGYGELQDALGAKHRSQVVGGQKFDVKLAREARRRGYDGIIYLHPAPPANTEVVQFTSTRKPAPTPERHHALTSTMLREYYAQQFADRVVERYAEQQGRLFDDAGGTPRRDFDETKHQRAGGQFARKFPRVLSREIQPALPGVDLPPEQRIVTRDRPVGQGTSDPIPPARPINRVIPVERHSQDGTIPPEGPVFFSPRGEGLEEYGSVKKHHTIAPQANLYRGRSSERLVKNLGLWDKPQPEVKALSGRETLAELDAAYQTGDATEDYFPTVQAIAQRELERRGYHGAEWMDEDGLSPHQFHIWDRSVIDTTPDPAADLYCSLFNAAHGLDRYAEGWDSIESSSTGAVPTPLRGPKAKPPALPRLIGVEPEDVQEAWSTVASRYPRIAQGIQEIRRANPGELPGQQAGEQPRAAYRIGGTLLLPHDHQGALQARHLFHEITHAAQDQRGNLKPRDQMTPDEFNALEIPAHARGQAVDRYGLSPQSTATTSSSKPQPVAARPPREHPRTNAWGGTPAATPQVAPSPASHETYDQEGQAAVLPPPRSAVLPPRHQAMHQALLAKGWHRTPEEDRMFSALNRRIDELEDSGQATEDYSLDGTGRATPTDQRVTSPVTTVTAGTPPRQQTLDPAAPPRSPWERWRAKYMPNRATSQPYVQLGVHAAADLQTDPHPGPEPHAQQFADALLTRYQLVHDQYATRGLDDWSDEMEAAPKEDVRLRPKERRDLRAGMKQVQGAFGDFSAIPEEQVGKTVRKNTDFDRELASGTTCPRQDQYVGHVRALQHHLGRLLGREERFHVGQLMQSYGAQPACWYCYGQSARDKAADLIQKGHTVFHEVARAHQTGEHDQLLDLAKRQQGTPEGRATRKRLRELYGEAPDENLQSGKTQAWSPGTRFAKYIRAHGNSPEHRAVWDNLPQLHDFALGYAEPTTDAEKLATKQLRHILTAGQVPTPQEWNSYRDDVLRMNPDDLLHYNKRAGLRLNSQTDFRPWHTLELAQMMTHLHGRRAMAHVYTRDPAMLDIFGRTGLKFNLSVGYARGPDGKVARDPVTSEPVHDMLGLDRPTAKRLRAQYPRNAGTILVPTSDHELETGLDDPEIDMLIPYHAGSVAPAVGRHQDAKDYKLGQHEDWRGFVPQGRRTFQEGRKTFRAPYRRVETLDGRPLTIRKGQQLTREHHRDNREVYLDLCDKLGIRPKFADVKMENGQPVTEHEHYMKLVRDVARRPMYHQVVDPRKINWEAAHQHVDQYVKSGGHQRDVVPNPAVLQMLKQDIEAGALEWMKRNQHVPGTTTLPIADPAQGAQVPREVLRSKPWRTKMPRRYSQQLHDALVERYAGKHLVSASGQKSFDWHEEDHPRGQPTNAGQFTKRSEDVDPRYHEWRTRHKHPDRVNDNYDPPPTYLTGAHTPDTQALAAEHGGLGLLITPHTKQYLEKTDAYSHVALDNGVFSEFTGTAPFSREKFLGLLDSAASRPQVARKVIFAVAPDKVGDWAATLERSAPYFDEIHKRGFPAAFAAQDGIEQHPELIPWDKFEVLFIGGSTGWKLGLEGIESRTPTPTEMRNAKTNYKFLEMLREAKRRGKTIHFGRVNSRERMLVGAYGLGADSMDGTMAKFGSSINVPKLKEWLNDYDPLYRGKVIPGGLSDDQSAPDPYSQFQELLGHAADLDRYKAHESPGQQHLFAKHDVADEPRDASGEWTSGGSAPVEKGSDAPPVEISSDNPPARPAPEPGSNEDLVARFKAGDKRAGDQLIEQNRRFIYGIARRYARNPSDLEDLWQEGAIAMVQMARSFDPERGTRFTTPAQTAIERHLAQVVGKQARRRGVWNQTPEDQEGRALQEPVAPPTPDPVETAERAASIRQAIERLPNPRHRLAIQMHYGIDREPRTQDQIAAEFGVSKQRVSALLASLLPRIEREVASLYAQQRVNDAFLERYAQQTGTGEQAPAPVLPHTETPEFKEWFGDSKIRHAETGKPLVVYHGTPTPGFDAFDYAKAGSNTGSPDAFHAITVTDDPGDAGTYAREDMWRPDREKNPVHPAIMPMYLRMENPLHHHEGELTPEVIRRAKKRGHDGIIRTWNDGSREYTVFARDQLKSATGNRGTYSKADPRINYTQAFHDAFVDRYGFLSTVGAGLQALGQRIGGQQTQPPAPRPAAPPAPPATPAPVRPQLVQPGPPRPIPANHLDLRYAQTPAINQARETLAALHNGDALHAKAHPVADRLAKVETGNAQRGTKTYDDAYARHIETARKQVHQQLSDQLPGILKASDQEIQRQAEMHRQAQGYRAQRADQLANYPAGHPKHVWLTRHIAEVDQDLATHRANLREAHREIQGRRDNIPGPAAWTNPRVEREQTKQDIQDHRRRVKELERAGHDLAGPSGDRIVDERDPAWRAAVRDAHQQLQNERPAARPARQPGAKPTAQPAEPPTPEQLLTRANEAVRNLHDPAHRQMIRDQLALGMVNEAITSAGGKPFRDVRQARKYPAYATYAKRAEIQAHERMDQVAGRAIEQAAEAAGPDHPEIEQLRQAHAGSLAIKPRETGLEAAQPTITSATGEELSTRNLAAQQAARTRAKNRAAEAARVEKTNTPVVPHPQDLPQHQDELPEEMRKFGWRAPANVTSAQQLLIQGLYGLHGTPQRSFHDLVNETVRRQTGVGPDGPVSEADQQKVASQIAEHVRDAIGKTRSATAAAQYGMTPKQYDEIAEDALADENAKINAWNQTFDRLNSPERQKMIAEGRDETTVLAGKDKTLAADMNADGHNGIDSANAMHYAMQILAQGRKQPIRPHADEWHQAVADQLGPPTEPGQDEDLPPEDDGPVPFTARRHPGTFADLYSALFWATVERTTVPA